MSRPVPGFRAPVDQRVGIAGRLYVHVVVIAGLACAWLTLSAAILEAIAPKPIRNADPHAGCVQRRHLGDRARDAAPGTDTMRATCATATPGPSVVGPRGYPHTTGPNSGGRAPGASAGFFPGL